MLDQTEHSDQILVQTFLDGAATAAQKKEVEERLLSDDPFIELYKMMKTLPEAARFTYLTRLKEDLNVWEENYKKAAEEPGNKNAVTPPMTKAIPFASQEVRWFFEGKVNQHKSLKHWFETVAPIPKNPGVGPPLWKGRLDDQPDIYLILPGSDDMGIKWREQELQIKGRVCSLGTHVFCGRHQGEIERWMKWSFSNTPTAYQRLFSKGKEAGLVTASVRKTRALRRVSLDNLIGKPKEVDVKTIVDRGFGFELTDLEVAGKDYCSLAFETFPNDSEMDAEFTQTVEAFLKGLREIDLTVAHSRSYPAWLGSINIT